MMRESGDRESTAPDASGAPSTIQSAGSGQGTSAASGMCTWLATSVKVALMPFLLFSCLEVSVRIMIVIYVGCGDYSSGTEYAWAVRPPSTTRLTPVT